MLNKLFDHWAFKILGLIATIITIWTFYVLYFPVEEYEKTSVRDILSTPNYDNALEESTSIASVCTLMTNTIDDVAKLDILSISLKQVQTLSGEQLMRIYECSGLWLDSSKESALIILTKKLQQKSLSHTQLSNILSSLKYEETRVRISLIFAPFAL